MKKMINCILIGLVVASLTGCFAAKTSSGHSMYYDRTGEDVKAGYSDPTGNEAELIIPKNPGN